MAGFRVYALTDSGGEARYVGATAARLQLRLAWHLANARRGRTSPVACWIRAMLARGHRPGIVLVAEARTSAEASAVERAWIAHLGDRGLNVLNVGYVPTLQHRMAIAAALRGRTAGLKTRLRMATANRAAWQRRRRAAAA